MITSLIFSPVILFVLFWLYIQHSDKIECFFGVHSYGTPFTSHGMGWSPDGCPYPTSDRFIKCRYCGKIKEA